MSDEIKQITIQIKPPRGNFPGKVAIGHYVIDVDGFVTLVDEHGKPTGDGRRRLGPDGDAKAIACQLLRSSRRYGNSRPSGFGFNDRLIYQKVRY